MHFIGRHSNCASLWRQRAVENVKRHCLKTSTLLLEMQNQGKSTSKFCIAILFPLYLQHSDVPVHTFDQWTPSWMLLWIYKCIIYKITFFEVKIKLSIYLSVPQLQTVCFPAPSPNHCRSTDMLSVHSDHFLSGHHDKNWIFLSGFQGHLGVDVFLSWAQSQQRIQQHRATCSSFAESHRTLAAWEGSCKC